MIEAGFKLGLGIAAAFGAVWIAGWVLVFLLAASDKRD